ncbi:MAG: AAA domain-containing protein [Pirellulaceae bacterium]
MSERTAILNLEALPPQTTKGTIVRLLEQVGQLDRSKVGMIQLMGRSATVEVPAAWLQRLVKALDGAAVGTQHIRAAGAGPSRAGSARDHFTHLIQLLEWESQAEAEERLRDSRRKKGRLAEQTGHTLVDLVLRDEFLGLGGRTILTLGKREVGAPIPWTRLGHGSPVLLSDQRAEREQGWRGVVSGIGSHTVEVALTQLPDWDPFPALLRLDLSADEVARQRQRAALERTREASGDRLAQLRGVLMGERPATFRPSTPVQPLDDGLNASQRHAVEFAMSAADVAIIHGPPGTGKTTTVVELIRQAVRRGDKVLACAPSNLAVDNLLERLAGAGERVVRLGHPARVLPGLREYALDLVVERHEDVKVARKLVREAHTLRDRASRYTRARPEPGAKREMREEARQLIADARRIESLVVRQVLDQADIICATTTGLDSELLGQRFFDLAVIDEACQTTEPGCWIPLLRANRLVLAGDHCQLPPTVVSSDAAREGFAISLLERLMASGEEALSRQLTVQYRMHHAIMEFSSEEFYSGNLVADPSVAMHRLADLPGVAEDRWTVPVLEFFDTAGASFDEQQEAEGESRWNAREGEIVQQCVTALVSAGLAGRDIGVIAPYAAQVRHLRDRIDVPELEIDTVDGFQGREKEAIVVSLVRSNAEGEIGFLADVRRMNVALTRARRKLVVIGDSATIASHPFYQRWLEFVELQGAYRTVWELPAE